MTQVRILAWSTISLHGDTQDDDNHAGRGPLILSPYSCSGVSSGKNNRSKEKTVKRTIASLCIALGYFLIRTIRYCGNRLVKPRTSLQRIGPCNLALRLVCSESARVA